MSRTSISRFLDLEAAVERDDEESEDPDETDGFIDDDIETEETPSSSRDLGFWSLHDGLADETVFERLFAGTRTSVATIEETHQPEYLPGVLLPHTIRPTDYPIWQVPCRLGVEESAVCHLLQTCRPKHELRSAFTRGPIRGFIYVEATMNQVLIDLLKITRGIVWGREGIHYKRIHEEEWQELLTIGENNCSPSVGDWVRILKGPYKGDSAYVSELEEWQGVSALLVPRIHVPELADDTVSAHKRKRSQPRPPPALFYPNLIPETSRLQPRLIRENVFMFGRRHLEHGLLRTSFDLTSVVQDVLFMPQSILNLFAASGHPEMGHAMFPCCREWKFEENELVTVQSTHQIGRIKHIRPCEAEIDLLSGEGLVNASWKDLRKVMALADYVEVLSGNSQGRSGWVVAIEETDVSVMECGGADPATLNITELDRGRQILHVHINWLKITEPPYAMAFHIAQVEKVVRQSVPWKGENVIVTKNHPMKGYLAKVVDAIAPKDPDSQPQLVLQFQHFNAGNSPSYVLSYNDVLHARTMKRLNASFPPEHSFYFHQSKAPDASPPEATTTVTTTSEAQTPMTNFGSTTPAWDPSSRTPGHEHLGSWVPTPSSSTSSIALPSRPSSMANLEHPLLDPRLAGKTIRAAIVGGQHRKAQAPVTIACNAGKVVLRQSWHQISHFLLPEWVNIKPANPTRDNGLLVVIRGEHCGKYVRRIHHRYENNDRHRPIMQLAVVDRQETGAEALTGEEFELTPEYLVQGFETDNEKNMNASLMVARRNQARFA